MYAILARRDRPDHDHGRPGPVETDVLLQRGKSQGPIERACLGVRLMIEGGPDRVDGEKPAAVSPELADYSLDQPSTVAEQSASPREGGQNDHLTVLVAAGSRSAPDSGGP